MAGAAGADCSRQHSGLEAAVKLRSAPAQYDRLDQQELRNELERADELNQKKGAHLLLRKDTRLELYDSNGVRWAVTVNTSGVLVVTVL